jgi:GntR family transcriptional regulator, transcriptional repressor for pyruvate dehydrogenase complex
MARSAPAPRRARPAKASTRQRSSIAIGFGDVVARPLKTSEAVAREIVRDVIAQGLTSGDSLPPEAAMLEQYGVSRESLREGLRLLEVQGLIRIRRGPGGGPIVGSVDPANLGRTSTLYFHLAGATYAELYEVWAMSEGILAQRAARNPDEALRRQLMEPYLVHDAAPTESEELAAFVLQQANFHGDIARLAQNRVIEITFQVFGQIVSHHMAIEDDPRGLHEELAHDHERLARAIIAGQPTKAMSIMIEHIESVAAFSAKRMGTHVHDYIEWI